MTKRSLRVSLGSVALACIISACGVPIHHEPTVVPKDKVPFHLNVDKPPSPTKP